MAFALTSPAFDADATIPRRYTCDGEDLSPALGWRDPPPGTRSLALICDDPDAPGSVFAHWGVWDIPAGRDGLAEGFGTGPADGLHQAINDFGKSGWGGPCPPVGHGPHRYRFRLLALDTDMLDVPPEADCRTVEAAARDHLLGETMLVGRYER
jgi:hypothetical protein